MVQVCLTIPALLAKITILKSTAAATTLLISTASPVGVALVAVAAAVGGGILLYNDINEEFEAKKHA